MAVLKPIELSDLIDAAKRIAENPRMTDVERFDAIFDMEIARKIRDAGYHFDWYDPDTTYEADVEAYVKALSEFQTESLAQFLPIPPDVLNLADLHIIRDALRQHASPWSRNYQRNMELQEKIGEVLGC